MSTQLTNSEIKETLEAHLPEAEHSDFWKTMTAQIAVSDETPIPLDQVWKALNTTVTAEKALSLWNALNRPVTWPFKA